MGNLLRKRRRPQVHFKDSRYETEIYKREIERIYNKIKLKMERKGRKYRDFSIYLNTNLDYNEILKRVQDRFWFAIIYYYDMGVVSMEYSSLRRIRRIGIHLERRFGCF